MQKKMKDMIRLRRGTEQSLQRLLPPQIAGDNSVYQAGHFSSYQLCHISDDYLH